MVHFLPRSFKTGIDFIGYEMEKSFQFILPFLFPCRFGKGKGFGNCFFCEASILHRFDNRLRFFSDTAHQLAVGAFHLFIHFGGPALDRIQGGVVLFSPQVVNGGHLVIGQTEELENAISQKVSLQRLSQDMKSHMDLAVLQLFNIVMYI